MPTTTILLGKNQKVSLDGQALDGVREIDIEVETRTVDVTPWNSPNASTLPLLADATVRMLIYTVEDWGKVKAKFLKWPPQRIQMSVTNAYDVPCLPVGVKVVGPINGVVAYEVVLRLYVFN